MGPAADKIHLVHFNDVYDIDSREKEVSFSLQSGSAFAIVFPTYR